MYNLQVDTGTGGYSITYDNILDLLEGMHINDSYISSTCLHKVKKWLYNRKWRHHKNIFKYDNILIEIY